MTLPFAHAYKGFEDNFMMDAFRRPRGGRTTPWRRPGFSSVRSNRPVRLAAWLALPALVILAVGCGGGSSKKAKGSTAVAESEQAQEEAAPADALPSVVKKKKAAAKPAEPTPPAPSTKDISKWQSADLDAALARKDVQFVPAVVLYGVRKPDDAKRADELDSLLRRVGRMKDDSPTIPLPLPAGAFADADNQTAAGQAGSAPAGTAPALTPNLMRSFRRRGKDDK